MRTLLKRYGMALTVLLLMVLLMILGTWGVTLFGEKMFEKTGVEMHPVGKKVEW